MGKIILASSSPRRAEILKTMKLEFEIIPSLYEEVHDRTVFSYDFIENLAYNKALSFAKTLHPQEKVVIGADTIVVSDNIIMGKPQNYQEAVNMLKTLSGKTHFVVTSIALINSRTLKYQIKSTTTYVSFNELSDSQIKYYIDTFKPFDKAGSYGIQELPKEFVNEVNGSLDNVIGLPSATLLNMLDIAPKD